MQQLLDPNFWRTVPRECCHQYNQENKCVKKEGKCNSPMDKVTQILGGVENNNISNHDNKKKGWNEICAFLCFYPPFSFEDD